METPFLYIMFAVYNVTRGCLNITLLADIFSKCLKKYQFNCWLCVFLVASQPSGFYLISWSNICWNKFNYLIFCCVGSERKINFWCNVMLVKGIIYDIYNVLWYIFHGKYSYFNNWYCNIFILIFFHNWNLIKFRIFFHINIWWNDIILYIWYWSITWNPGVDHSRVEVG